MTYWRTARPMSGAQSSTGPISTYNTRADSIPALPPKSILHCEDISDPPLNVGTVIRDAILGSITGVLLAVAVFFLMFVDLR